MPTAPITRTLLKNPPALPKGADKVRFFDPNLKGFIAEVRARCTTFYFRYSDLRRRTREIKLGRFGDVTVEQARKRAEQLKAEVSLGGDPLAAIEQLRSVPRYCSFIEERYLPHVRDNLRSYRNVEAYCKRIRASFGSKALDEITVADVAALRRRLMAEGLSNASVNRHLATVRSTFNLARRWGYYRGDNPASSPGMLAEEHRDRYLDAAQTQALFRAYDLEPNRDAGAALALITLTGARKNEVLKARWVDVDLTRNMLTVPRSKNGRKRHIPLSPMAQRVLRMQWARRPKDHPFVFPGTKPGEPLENLRGAWDRAKKKARLAADLRIHDLRHNLASALANAGTPLSEIGVILGHRTLATTQRYAHHSSERLIETATVATRAWNLLPAGEDNVG